MNVGINREACIGCGVCTHICPEVFEMDDENVATVKPDVNPDSYADEVRDAAESCPVDAIQIDEQPMNMA